MRCIHLAVALSLIVVGASKSLASETSAAASAPNMNHYIWLARNLIQEPGFTFDPHTDSMVIKGSNTPNPEDSEYKWLLAHAQQYRKDDTLQRADVMSGTAADHVLDKAASIPYVPKSTPS